VTEQDREAWPTLAGLADLGSSEMTDEPVGDLTPTGAWIHAHVRFIDQIAGTLLVMSLPAGLAVRIHHIPRRPAGLRSWLSDWLQARRAVLLVRNPQELHTPVAFMWLSVTRAVGSSEYTLHEFSYGTAPEAPATWPEVSLEHLLLRATADLNEH
jgi:hypothetical protein